MGPRYFPLYIGAVIDFSIPRDLLDLRDRTRAFVADQVVPFETDPRYGDHGPSDDLVRELQALAKAAGLLSPHVHVEFGGLGLSQVGRAIVFEEAGYSPLGSLALNVSAPDEGNAHLLGHVATPAQKEQWLRPHAAGELRTCFAMSEPPPGAGSDPSALATTADRDGDTWVINGVKQWITGAQGASVCIVMARTGEGEATMFLVPMDAPGISIERPLHTIDSQFAGGHMVLRFDGVRVVADQILGELGQGFRYAQVRLAPARLTHCMRHLGGARRAHDIATEYTRGRQAFGQPLVAHEGVSYQLADNEMDLRSCRLLIWHTAWLLDQGERCNEESSQAKVVCSEAIWRIVDRCVQVMGGTGVSDETIVSRIFRDVRPFRIYDGPSEVHRWSLGRKIAKRGAPVPT
jgi:acyl-CoA dehydrogenase